MELVTPGLGLIFWMTLSFGILVFVLKKFAWGPILKMIHEREQNIEISLNEAKKAHSEFQNVKQNSDKLIQKAKEEKLMIIAEGNKIKDSIIEEAKIKASEEAHRIIEKAHENIHFEKMNAITELKNQLAILSIEIAEKLLQEELQDKTKQNNLIEKMISQVNFN